jgi:hypothetical protein
LRIISDQGKCEAGKQNARGEGKGEETASRGGSETEPMVKRKTEELAASRKC